MTAVVSLENYNLTKIKNLKIGKTKVAYTKYRLSYWLLNQKLKHRSLLSDLIDRSTAELNVLDSLINIGYSIGCLESYNRITNDGVWSRLIL